MFTKRMVAGLIAVAFLATGCATTGADPNYLAMLDAQKSIGTVNAQAQLKIAEAKVAQMTALQKIGETGDPQSRQMAVMALAVLGGNGGLSIPNTTVNLPGPPESGSDKALKWASIFAGPIVALGTGYFGYKMGVAQSNNQAATTIAGYNTFGQMANSGYTAASNIATAGFNSNGTLAGFIQAPQPNQTISGSGVIGSGSFTTTTDSYNRNCSSGNGASGGAGTTAGGTGGASGAANC